MSSKKPACMRTLQSKKLLIFSWAVIILFIWMLALAPAGLFYRFVTLWQVRDVMAGAPAMQWTTDHFVVRYEGDRQSDAQIVAQSGEAVIEQIHRDFGLSWNQAEKVSVIVMNDRQSLSQSLGLGSNHSVLGAYYRGVVWVLAPHVWIPERSETKDYEKLSGKWRAKHFQKEGPMVHELTHLVLDRRTRGQIPAWLNEGLAQFEEYKLNGWEWIEPANRLDQTLYSLDELSLHFDRLENQALAYRQSYLFIRFFIDIGGSESLTELLDGLQAGKSDRLVLEEALRTDWSSIESHYRQWLKNEVLHHDRAYFSR